MRTYAAITWSRSKKGSAWCAKKTKTASKAKKTCGDAKKAKKLAKKQAANEMGSLSVVAVSAAAFSSIAASDQKVR